MNDWEKRFLDEISALCKKHTIKEFTSFIFWYIKSTNTDDLSDEDILNDCITDRSKDGGGDAIIISHRQKLVKIIQSKFTCHVGQTMFNKDELTKLSNIGGYVSGRSDYNILRKYVHTKMKSKLDDAISYVKDRGYNTKLVFITTHRENRNSNICKEDIDIISSKEIRRLFEEWERGHTPELGNITLSYLDILAGPKEPSSYIVQFPANQFRDIYKTWKEKLFSKNVRIFYGSSNKTNNSIKKTLTEQAQCFWYYNNGITILSNKIDVRKNTNKIILKDPQIINGCQTVTTIGENNPSDASLLAKIIEIGDNDTNQEFIDGIIESNNRQTPIDERILKSNHPLQVKLERDLLEWGYYYERKEKKYREEKKVNPSIGKLTKIDNKHLLQSNLCLVRKPHLVFSDENELFSTYFADVFKKDKSLTDYLLPYLMYSELHYIANNYYSRRNSFNKLATFHILRILTDNCSELKDVRVQYDLCRDLKDQRSSCDKKIVRKILDIAYKKYKSSKYVEQYSGQRDYFKAHSTYDELVTALPKSLKRDIEGVII